METSIQETPKKILIVDDMPLVRAALRRLLGKLGTPCVCYEAKDGIDALRYLMDETIDLVLLDWNMPNLSGLDFLNKTRELKMSMPIIMVTGEADIEKVQRAMLAGVTDYIIKPVLIDVLREKLRKLDSFKGLI